MMGFLSTISTILRKRRMVEDCVPQWKAQEMDDLEELEKLVREYPLLDDIMSKMEEAQWCFDKLDVCDVGTRKYSFQMSELHIVCNKYCAGDLESYDIFSLVRCKQDIKREIAAEFSYVFADHGFAPISGYRSISVHRVLGLVEAEWKLRMKKRVPEIVFGPNYYRLSPSQEL